ncbi:MAG: UpxY family transcription antiterminator [Acidobacteriota bacterium]|nr:UpxY family transcription antiterminator [Acidobacteriota bacterium]
MKAPKTAPKIPPQAEKSEWFAVYTAARHEKHVAQLLQERGVETFLPLYEATHRWHKRRPVELQLPLFPTYVFVRIERRARGVVLAVPGVLAIVGAPGGPWPLPEFEIEAMRSGLHLRRAEPHEYLAVGTRVRIKSGALAGMEGVLERTGNGLRVVLSLDGILRSVAVEVSREELEALPRDGSGVPVPRIGPNGTGGARIAAGA